MGFGFFRHLRAFLDRHGDDGRVDALRVRFSAALSRCRLEETLALYEEALDLAEVRFWAGGAREDELAGLQALHREREALLALEGEDRRHRFLVVIPVADRPGQLGDCLESLLELCHAFGYGGTRDGRLRAVEVLVADDSADGAARREHARLAESFTLRGLAVEHFTPARQAAFLERLGEEAVRALEPVIGPFRAEAFWHKGPSRMRNLTALYLLHRGTEPRRLCWFVDSDEEFRVLHCGPDGRRALMAVNYFHHLDRLFRRPGVHLVTGKVVGDPPVAPAVMAGNFLADLKAFLEEAAGGDPEAPCPFHGERGEAGHAAYHDLAGLFGIPVPEGAQPYRCQRREAHRLVEAFGDLAGRLDAFFDGAHPTRVTCFDPGTAPAEAAPARTVYTGNYVADAVGLRHFIPFAPLGLRMAGPVLGRLLRRELGEGFLAANLPLLHRRTPAGARASEYRPGVRRGKEGVDLSAEFLRQFEGDLVLFTVERLTAAGYPDRPPAPEAVARLLERVRSELLERYRANLARIRHGAAAVAERLERPEAWWHRHPQAAEGVTAFRRFLAAVEANFGPGAPAPRALEEAGGEREALVDALCGLADARRRWAAVLAGA